MALQTFHNDWRVLKVSLCHTHTHSHSYSHTGCLGGRHGFLQSWKITGQKSRADRPPARKHEQWKKGLPMQINKIAPRFFYTHPDLRTLLFLSTDIPHAHTYRIPWVCHTCCLATSDGGKKELVVLQWLKFPRKQCLIPCTLSMSRMAS